MTQQEAFDVLLMRDVTDDPQGQAIHNATQAIYDLFEVLSVESAHWLATVAIINAERAARARQ